MSSFASVSPVATSTGEQFDGRLVALSFRMFAGAAGADALASVLVSTLARWSSQHPNASLAHGLGAARLHVGLDAFAVWVDGLALMAALFAAIAIRGPLGGNARDPSARTARAARAVRWTSLFSLAVGTIAVVLGDRARFAGVEDAASAESAARMASELTETALAASASATAVLAWNYAKARGLQRRALTVWLVPPLALGRLWLAWIREAQGASPQASMVALALELAIDVVLASVLVTLARAAETAADDAPIDGGPTLLAGLRRMAGAISGRMTLAPLAFIGLMALRGDRESSLTLLTWAPSLLFVVAGGLVLGLVEQTAGLAGRARRAGIVAALAMSLSLAADVPALSFGPVLRGAGFLAVGRRLEALVPFEAVSALAAAFAALAAVTAWGLHFGDGIDATLAKSTRALRLPLVLAGVAMAVARVLFLQARLAIRPPVAVAAVITMLLGSIALVGFLRVLGLAVTKLEAPSEPQASPGELRAEAKRRRRSERKG